MKIILIDLFSGIGGFSKGLQEAGFEITQHYFSEINKPSINNYKYNFKDAEHLGSVTDVSGTAIRAKHPNAKIVVTFGSPCQDFSMAGLRAGMDGQRSSLIGEAIRVLHEIRPLFYIWENVAGAFTSNARKDFWAIIHAFANVGTYRTEWQLLNTSWFLPQNRERLYVVGYYGKAGGQTVFPIEETDCHFTKQYTEQSIFDKEIANCLVKSYAKHPKQVTYLKVKQVNLAAEYGEQPRQQNRIYDESGISPSLTVSKAYQLKIRQKAMPKAVASRGRKRNGKWVQELEERPDTNTNTLTSVAKDNLVKQDEYSYRMLTEIESERLQGFPDNWTQYGLCDKKGVYKLSKTARYQLIGDAVTVDVVKAVGVRILDVLTNQ